MSIPRLEYPRPQMVRPDWMNLNGTWEFAIDFGNSGEEQQWHTRDNFPQTILVPFCPESPLSQVGYTDFMPAVWYRRELDLPASKLEGRQLLHFGAVDYHCKVWINGQLCGSHSGGYASFTLDATELLLPGQNSIIVRALDDLRSGKQPFGKQSPKYQSFDCSYTRTTGIWQTVWLEFVPDTFVERYQVIPLPEDSAVSISVWLGGAKTPCRLQAAAYYDGAPVGRAEVRITGGFGLARLELSEAHLWEPGSPALYDLSLTIMQEDHVLDSVDGYFGLRSVSLRGGALCINGRPVFLRMVLDQGFNPEGICTAPDDEFLKRDIELSMELGFNGARFHQRVFEERSLYWADRLGYLVWGEFANNSDMADGNGIKYFLPEWTETVKRDFNHPSLIGWIPFNETYWVKRLDPSVSAVVRQVTKDLDPTRPVIDASGGLHNETDMFDIHNYEQDPDVFRASFEPMKDDSRAFCNPLNQPVLSQMVYRGEPYWVSEYGGTYWNGGGSMEAGDFGYGDNPRTEEEFRDRYAGLAAVLLEHPKICGFCYTQLTDVEQERNGLYYYDRSRKFSDSVYEAIRRANSAPAAIE